MLNTQQELVLPVAWWQHDGLPVGRCSVGLTVNTVLLTNTGDVDSGTINDAL